jgi:hypothetical protein
MGVPVVVLAGGNFVGRMGASFMNALGLPDWVAGDEAGYVESAVRLAADIGTLRSGRELLRELMAASPLCDIKTYVAHFEALLQRMWAVYCAGSPQRVIETKVEPKVAAAGKSAAAKTRTQAVAARKPEVPQSRGALRRASDRSANRRCGPLAAHRGHRGRTLRCHHSARRAQSDGAGLQG